VRFCEIPARVDEVNGAFEFLHDFGSPKLFSEHLMSSSRRYYGTACRAFLRCLVRMSHDHVCEVIQQHRRRFVERYVPTSAVPEVARAGDRFSLVAAGGEFLTSLGITALETGEAEAAAGSCFEAWRSERGTNGQWDEMQAIRWLRASLIAHGNSRLQPHNQRSDGQRPKDDSTKTLNRIGFRSTTVERETEYQVMPDMLRDLCGPFSQELVLRALRKRKLLNGCAENRLTAQRTLPEIGRTRCYAISSRIFDDDE
jgi:putative DNA primase/helicase